MPTHKLRITFPDRVSATYLVCYGKQDADRRAAAARKAGATVKVFHITQAGR